MADDSNNNNDNEKSSTDQDSNGQSGSALTCAFCGKSEQEVKKIVVAGALKKPICNECIVTCQQILKDTL